MKYLFYINEILNTKPIHIDPKYTYKFWYPSFTSVLPKGLKKFSALVWRLFHHLKLFANSNYGIFLIYDNEKLIHRSFIFPKYFRLPFMAKNDLQIGDTNTDPNYRGKNLATFAIQEIVQSIQDPRVRVLSDGKNRKLSARLNQIASDAKYDLIARIDADDIMFPKRLAIQSDCFVDQEIQMVSSGICTITDNNQIRSLRNCIGKYDITLKGFLQYRHRLIHPVIMSRK
jgi:hypothetical protein